MVGLACLNLALPAQRLAAAERVATRPASRPITDVALGVGGVLQGQLTSTEGKPLAKQRIAVVRQNELVAQTMTDGQGRFAVRGLRGGLYQVACEKGLTTCRCWAPRTAPPAANRQVLVVADGQIERGQMPITNLFCNPIVIGLVLGAAIAIPIAVHNSNDDAS